MKMKEEKEIKVKLVFRQGEYGQTARLEFPHPWYIIKILEVTPLPGQKRYKLHHFDNILVAKNYIKDLEKFLQRGASKFGVKIKFVPEGK